MLWANPVWLGHFNEHSLIQLNQQVLHLVPGQSLSGVELIARRPQGVDIRWQGRRMQLPLAKPPDAIQTRGTEVAGRIGLIDVNWRIDTGSSDLVISQTLADRIGVTPGDQRRLMSHSAGQVSGWVAPAPAIQLGPWLVPVKTVVVLPGDYPTQPLFGLSGLSRMRLQMQGLNLRLQPLAGSGIIPAPIH